MVGIEITHVINFKRELKNYEEERQELKQLNWGELTLDCYLERLIADTFYHIYGHNGYEANIYKIRFEDVDFIGKEKIKSVIDEFFSKRSPYDDEDEIEHKRVYDYMMSEVNLYDKI